MTGFQHWRHRLSVPQFTVVTGLLVIAIGTMLMATPLCSTEAVGLWEALFTVTSAITVTGLSVINVSQELTLVGQVLLAGLILTGGLGLMAITTFLQGFVQGRSGLRERLDRGRALDEFGVGGIGPTFHQILIIAAVVIGLGTLVLYIAGFTSIHGRGERLWAALFHCISAYNNAGFGLWANNLEDYRSNGIVNLVIALLIVMGGIGWRVTNDIWLNRFRLRRIRRLSLHTRLVIRSTIALILIGAIGLLCTEQVATEALVANLSWWDRIQVALFQSVSTRTAGFNTIPLSTATLSDAGLLLMMGLMFIGASPGGTGGGIKTTTFAALVAATSSTLRGEEAVVVRNREIPSRVVLRAIGVALASALFVLGMTLLLTLGTTTESSRSFTFLEKLFTCVSAFGTVGLDVGVTAQLNRWGQAVLMIGMFVGRVGILLLLSAIYGSRPQNRVGYPREELYI